MKVRLGNGQLPVRSFSSDWLTSEYEAPNPNVYYPPADGSDIVTVEFVVYTKPPSSSTDDCLILVRKVLGMVETRHIDEDSIVDICREW